MPPSPTLSIQLVTFGEPEAPDPATLLAWARAAEEAGVDRLVVSDHVVFGESLDDYGDPRRGGVSGGRQPTGPDGSWLEPLTVLAGIAAVTERIRLQTGILLAALRRPVVLAKTAATLDRLSGGRLDLGVGVGWQRAEYAAAGLDFRQRGRLLDHTLSVCRALWTTSPAAVHDEFLDVEGLHAAPRPSGGIPVWISGRPHRRVVERIVRHGDGWIPWGEHMADPRPGLAIIAEALRAAGRDPAELAVQAALTPVRDRDGRFDAAATFAPVPDLVAGGVTDVKAPVRLPADPAAARERLDALVAAFREALDTA
ncbi:MAG: TIGR03619 family F420-dependent LLM class oxidoreductase [Actinomyces sp.]|nr:MAG: TIGR03619 family F420-dependent LLM class oxidoreductase [Actinomyces sp.]